jgi:hypothetical protein
LRIRLKATRNFIEKKMSKRKRYCVIIRLESRLICRQVGEAAGEVKVNPNKKKTHEILLYS